MNVAYRRKPSIEASRMKVESLLYDAQANRFCRLNETAAFLWERLDRPATARELATELCRRFAGAELERAEVDVRNVLEQLCDLGVIAKEQSPD